ncbi:FAD-dependent oxidoreductase [Saccharobesus litoralis]|uniref:FAD-dependent oxidoreductase n=1 Tax=Saccharobesus litoralis TaxID=2172099 RepID=A0A2S0VLK0_9ALTE|nr:FAD-dependent oxidoreductase [Saccharobesus litoralis]AWB65083.1 FAD-dependent oxidoreductase [Saccharobesus litoralis]
MTSKSAQQPDIRVGIIGGGVGGATIALQLSALGVKVVLLEKASSLVSGPPFCHLHAGGNLYRDISDQQCFGLLKQSIDTAKLYKQAIDYRPTIVAVPKRDKGSPNDVIVRLKKLQQEYQRLIQADPQNQVLGKASHYYTLFERKEIEQLAQLPTPDNPQTPQQWMIEFAKNVDLEQLQFPLALVQEYGISTFRLAASVSLALQNSTNCQVYTDTQVTGVSQNENSNTKYNHNSNTNTKHNNKGWVITAEHQGKPQTFTVDYLINACGFKTGSIDDMLGLNRPRMVEFKAAYISRRPSASNNWPEVVFHGERGTHNGMTQLTPYPDGYFQIHGMTPEITLFEQGLVASKQHTAQPQLPAKFLAKVEHQWDQKIVNTRTNKAIEQVAQFIPAFANATVGSNPMYGAQQIPGQDPTLRVADVTFDQHNYARCEIVKASAAISAAETIVENLCGLGLIANDMNAKQVFSLTDALSAQQIAEQADKLAKERGYPLALARRNNPSVTNSC